MWKDILRGLCWITGSGELDIVPGLVFTMWITRTSSRDTPRTPFSGSKTSWLPINYIIIMDGQDSSIFGTDVSRISICDFWMVNYFPTRTNELVLSSERKKLYPNHDTTSLWLLQTTKHTNIQIWNYHFKTLFSHSNLIKKYYFKKQQPLKILLIKRKTIQLKSTYTAIHSNDTDFLGTSPLPRTIIIERGT